MYLILAGCEYAGTTTLAHAINEWMQETMGTEFKLIHDHFKLPDTKPHGPDLTPDEIAAFQRLSPRLTEVIQRHNLYYHTPWDSGSSEPFMGIGLYFEELVYAPLYYGYGRDAFSDRRRRAREWDRALLEFAPETVLVLLRASPEAIRERMRAAPRPDGVPREEDVERVIDLFEEQYASTELKHKLAIRTSGVTVAESVAEFAGKVSPFLTDEDRRRRG
jgi:hypothetical protein